MLGPADEFGQREQYSPTSIRVVGKDFFADAQSIPQLTWHIRGTPEYSRNGRYPIPFENDDPSFIIDEDSDIFNLNISPEEIQAFIGYRAGFSGAKFDFVSLLTPGIESEVFNADEGSVLPNSIWPYLPQVEGALPDVYFVVDYFRTDYNNFVVLGDSRRFSLLAVPQVGLFSGDGTSIPEPRGIVLAAFSLVALLTFRRVLTVR